MKTIKLFYSYSHEDEKLRNRLEIHLTGLKNQKIIDDWHDRKIGLGREWKDDLDKNLEAADIILLLVSPDFIASNYCYDIELTYAMQQHEAGAAVVIPIILEFCDATNLPFMKLQGAPKDMKPVTSWTNQNEAFTDIAKKIRMVAEDIRKTKAALSSEEQHNALLIESTTLLGEKISENSPSSLVFFAAQVEQVKREKQLVDNLVKEKKELAYQQHEYEQKLQQDIARLEKEKAELELKKREHEAWLKETQARLAQEAAELERKKQVNDKGLARTFSTVKAGKQDTFTVYEKSFDINGTELVMVYVPAGEFMMGSNDGHDDEKPVHKVKIEQAFYMGKFPVTVRQFRSFVEAEGYLTEAEKGDGAYVYDGSSWIKDKKYNCRSYAVESVTV